MLVALVLTAIFGGIMALGWAVSGGFLSELLSDTGSLALGRKKQEATAADAGVKPRAAGRKMPYAPAIAVGTLLSFFAG
jgi:prepilin peptidase CpaA